MYIVTDEEKEFLKNYDANKYPKPCVTVDNIIWTIKDNNLYVLLIKRKNYPFKGCWALPGGFLDVGKENTYLAAKRELQEETTLNINSVELFGVYSDPDRDPRDHVVSVVYSAHVWDDNLNISGQDDAEDAKFYKVDFLGNIDGDLAFDHNTILKDFYIKVASNLIEH